MTGDTSLSQRLPIQESSSEVREADLRVASIAEQEYETYHHVQLHPDTAEEAFPDVDEGDMLVLQNTSIEFLPQIYGKLQFRDMDRDEVGMGLDFRHALGAPLGSTIRVIDIGPRRRRLKRSLTNRIFGMHPLILRTRKAIFPDLGWPVCRIPERSFDLLGIDPGDRVVVQNMEKKVTLKALPITQKLRDIRKHQSQENPERYLDCSEALSIEEHAGTGVDIPSIYIDGETRQELSLDQKPNSGECQPVRVHPKNRTDVVKTIDDISVELILGLIAILVTLEAFLTGGTVTAIIIVILLVVAATVTFRVRY